LNAAFPAWAKITDPRFVSHYYNFFLAVRYRWFRDYPDCWNDIGRTLGNIVFVVEYGLLGRWFCRSSLGLGCLRLRRCTSRGNFLYYLVPILGRGWLCSRDLGDGRWLGLGTSIDDALDGAFQKCRTHHLERG